MGTKRKARTNLDEMFVLDEDRESLDYERQLVEMDEVRSAIWQEKREIYGSLDLNIQYDPLHPPSLDGGDPSRWTADPIIIESDKWSDEREGPGITVMFPHDRMQLGRDVLFSERHRDEDITLGIDHEPEDYIIRRGFDPLIQTEDWEANLRRYAENEERRR